MMMMIMSMGKNYVSEGQVPAGFLFIPKVIYEHGEPWWIDDDERKIDLSTRALWQPYQ
jgi:hypothetical protein